MLTINTHTHSYSIKIERGSLENVGDWLKSIWTSQKVAIITDTKVGSIYAFMVEEKLLKAGFQPVIITVPEGEKSKSLVQTANLYEFLAEKGFTRSDGILALGGGVVGDLAGFVAATYMRGIHFVQVPTSLLAQVDSSIGGKTGVNTTSAKNLVGAFYQPDGVLIDPNVLDTLEVRRVREGIAEIVKSAVIANRVFWDELKNFEDEYDLLRNAESVILQALQVKQKVVQEDEYDNGSRLTLNFGHTIGHAIEKNIGYGVVSHGEAVSIGMVKISEAAGKTGLMPIDIANELKILLEKFHLPTNTNEFELDKEKVFQAITMDKKTRGEQLKIILLEEIGKAKIVSIVTEDFRSFLDN